MNNLNDVAGRLALLGLSGLLAAIAPCVSAFGDPVVTVTAQSRTVTASATCGQTRTDSTSAPGLSSWHGTAMTGASTQDGWSSWADADQTSNILPDRLFGSLGATRGQWLGCSSSAAASCSLTFSITQPLQFLFQATATQGSFALSEQFEFTVSGGQTQTASGLLQPGTYTLSASTSAANPFTGQNSATYSLYFSEGKVVIPSLEVVGGPFTRAENCRRYVQLAPSTWTQAQARAVELGGHLVTINDAAEQVWVESTFAAFGPENKWIGMRRLGIFADFRWVSGQGGSYSNWASAPSTVSRGGQGYYAPGGRWNQSYDGFPYDAAGGIVEVAGGCRCDWNLDGGRTSTDFFNFLTDFFGAGADFDCSGSTTSADFFGFLECFFASACP